MPWNPIRRATLRARLLLLLLPGMAVLLAVGLWTTYLHAVQAAHGAFDRSLLGALRGLDLNVSTRSGGLSVEQPFQLFEFFELTASGPVHFRVATDDDRVEIGSPDLPLPDVALEAGQPRFYDAVYLGEAVRVGALRRPIDPPIPGASTVVIQVAEPVDVRARFVSAFIRQAVARDALLLGMATLTVAAVAGWALRPVRRLARSTRRRDAQDLDPLPTEDLPRDLVPLVDAINQQIHRNASLMEQRRHFLDDASHQLRTPLTTLRAQLDYALRESDPKRLQAALGALSAELDHATHATNQLLLLARADEAPLQTEPLDVAALAREVALELLPLAKAAGIDFGVDAPEEALPAQGDRLQLRTALSNLAHNAIVHGGGPITVEAGSSPGGGWRLGVVDGGPGLPPDLLHQAGHRFVKGRGSRGAGLGLAMAKVVAERHGGRLSLTPAGASESARPGLRATLHWSPR